jgi:hypothetical protein
VRSKAPERPKLGPLVPVIDAILEADKTALPKQRHTAEANFRTAADRTRLRLRLHGGEGLRADHPRRSREVFIPLVHPPSHAQVEACA